MKKSISLILVGFFISATFASPNLVVKFNASSKKYHFLQCNWAKKCSKKCAEINLEDAISKGGVPCKVCKPPKK